MRFLLPLIVLWGAVFTIPFEVSAQPTLVQCGNTIQIVDCAPLDDAGNPVLNPDGSPAEGYRIEGECTFCDFLKMGQNIINFMVYALAIVATLLFMYAGILYLTAAGNQGNIGKAHSIFTNVFIGLIIVLAAWLIVDIVLSVLTGKKVGPWTAPICEAVDNPCRAKNVDTGEGEGDVSVTYCMVCKSSSGALTTACGATAGLAACQEKEQTCTDSGNIVQNACSPRVTTGPSTCTPATSGECSINSPSMERFFGANKENASRICMGESSGNPNSESTVDRTRDGKAFSCGLFQINLTVHDLNIPECRLAAGREDLDCKRAFSGGINRNATVTNLDLYNACVTAAKNPQCNMAKAARISSGGGSWRRDWTNTATNCGIF